MTCVYCFHFLPAVHSRQRHLVPVQSRQSHAGPRIAMDTVHNMDRYRERQFTYTLNEPQQNFTHFLCVYYTSIRYHSFFRLSSTKFRSCTWIVPHLNKDFFPFLFPNKFLTNTNTPPLCGSFLTSIKISFRSYFLINSLQTQTPL